MASIYGRLLNSNSKKGQEISHKAVVQTDEIALSSVYSNDGNFYPMDDIEGLAQKIHMVGLMEPLVVKYAPCEKGEYCIIGGERRWRALKLLTEQGVEGFEKVSVCIRAPKNAQEEQVELILNNAYRTKDTATLIQEEQMLKSTLEQMKLNNVPLNGYDLQKGKLRDIVADILNVSPTKIGELEAIRKHLSPEFMKKVENGQLNASTAYGLSKLSEKEQADMLEIFAKKQKISVKDIEEYKGKMQAVDIQSEEEEEQLPGPEEAGGRYDSVNQADVNSVSDDSGIKEKNPDGKITEDEGERLKASADLFVQQTYGIPLYKYIRDRLSVTLMPKVENEIFEVIYELLDGYKNYIMEEKDE